jgi:hypothetical protein
MKRTLVVCALLSASLTAPAVAFLGIGDIVYDPSNYAQAIQQLAQLEQQYAQLVETYQMIKSQYDHMVRMAQQVPVNMAERYRARGTPWRNASSANTYGNSGGWINGVNTGVGVASGYAQATQDLAAYGQALANVSTSHLDRLKTDYATVELTDGANLYGIETVGRLRANGPQIETAILGLEDDSLSSDPAMNTEIAVLNKINAASMIALRSGQDTNQLMVALVERELIEAKRTRDAEARAFNSHIRFMTEGKAAMAAQAADASAAMLAWRMP